MHGKRHRESVSKRIRQQQRGNRHLRRVAQGGLEALFWAQSWEVDLGSSNQKVQELKSTDAVLKKHKVSIEGVFLFATAEVNNSLEILFNSFSQKGIHSSSRRSDLGGGILHQIENPLRVPRSAVFFLHSHLRASSRGCEEKNPHWRCQWGFSVDAENEGFEPPVPCGTLVFKTSAIDHSANSPRQK